MFQFSKAEALFIGVCFCGGLLAIGFTLGAVVFGAIAALILAVAQALTLKSVLIWAAIGAAFGSLPGVGLIGVFLRSEMR